MTRYGYDAAGNPDWVWSPSAVAQAANNPLGLPTINTFTADRLLASTIEPVSTDGTVRRHTGYGYDSSGRKTSQAVDEIAGTNPAVILEAGGTQSFEYTVSGWPAVQTGRDGGSRQRWRHHADGTPLGRQLAVGTGYATVADDTTWTSSPARTVTGIVDDSGDTWSIGHDVAGRPTTVVDRDGWNRVNVWNPDSSLERTSLYDGSSSDPLLDRFVYDYDARGRIAARSRAGTISLIDTYGYDGAGRLTDLNGTTATYDPDGNRTSLGQTTWSYRADDSIATSDPDGAGLLPARSYAHDAAGRLESDGCTVYGYDGFDRTATVGPDGLCLLQPSAAYGYDGLGRTRTISDSSGTSLLDHAADGQAVWRADGPDAAVVYTAGPDGTPVAVADGTDDHTLGGDGHGTVTLATHASGTACIVDLDPWGTPRSPGISGPCQGLGDSPNEVWYRGGRRDQATGQYTFGARRYNPTDAAWLTPDRHLAGPAGADLSIGVDPLTRNRYTYVNGDPVNYIDPTGHRLCIDGLDCRIWVDPITGEVHAPSTEGMPGATPTVFPPIEIPVVPEWGVVTINLFIMQEQAGIGPTRSMGNGRPFSNGASCVETKACIVLDFTTGELTGEINYTCRPNGTCFDALPIGDGNDIHVRTDDSGAIVIDVEGTNPLAWLGIPSINNSIVVGPQRLPIGKTMFGAFPFLDVDFGVRITGDSFPSVEVYQDLGGRRKTLIQDVEGWAPFGIPWGLFPFGERRDLQYPSYPGGLPVV